MLLTIHNLPSNTRYCDLKSLLQARCGLSQLILDNLENEGNLKKVTVGVVEEEDAALIVRKINGIYIGGNQVYVEDMRQKKPSSEQPYRPVPQQNDVPNMMSSNNSAPMPQQQDFTATNFPPMGGQFPNFYNPAMMTQEQMAMMTQQMMSNMYMFQGGYYPDPQQQMQYQQQQQMQQSQPPISQERPTPVPPATTNTDRPDARASNWKANVPYYQTNQSSHSPQRDQSSNRQSNSYNRNRSRSPQGYNNRERGETSGNRYQNSGGYTKNVTYGMASASRTSNNARSPSPRNRNSYYRQEQNDNGNSYGARSSRDNNPQGWGTRSSNNNPQGWEDRSSTDNRQGRGARSSTDNPQGWGGRSTDNPQGWGGRSSTNNSQGWGDRPSKGNSQGWEARSSTNNPQGWGSRSSADKQQSRGPNSATNNKSNWEAAKANKPYQHPPSPYRWSRDSATNSQQSNAPRASAPTKTPWNKNGQNPGGQFQNKPRPDTYKNQAAPKNNQNQLSESNSKKNKSSYEHLLQKDETWKNQAAAFLQKEISQSGECPESFEAPFVRTLRKAVLTRIELVLQAQVGVPLDDIVQRYRKTFPRSEDVTFFKAVMKSFKEKLEQNMGQTGNMKPAVSEKKEVKAAPTANVNVPAMGASDPAKTANKSKGFPKNNAQAFTIPKQPPHMQNRLPKYPSDNKMAYKQQKKIQEAEFENEDCYQLEPLMANALSDEIDQIWNLVATELATAVDPDEKTVCSGLITGAHDMFRKSVKMFVTKRILNIRTNLIVRVFSQGRPPTRAQVDECMKQFNVSSVKKSVGKKLFYTANCPTYEDYDRMCAAASVPINEQTTLIFKSFQLLGPKKNLKKMKRNNKKNQKQPESQIDDGNEQNFEDFENFENNENIKEEDEEIILSDAEDVPAEEQPNVDMININDQPEDFEDW